MFAAISEILFFVWGHFWKYKPPGGLPETRPWFLETRLSLKSKVLESVWFISFNDFLKPVANKQARGTNFLRRF